MEALAYFDAGIDSCFLLRLDLNKCESIKKECFILASGDALEVGDVFSKIGKKGSAGNQQIMPMKPWVQRYLGRLLIDDEIIDLGFPSSYKDRDFVLFDALNTDNLTEGFAFNKKKNAYFSSDQGYVMAYLDMGDGTLLHIRTSGSSSICKCDCLERVTLSLKTEGVIYE